jgi:hypothetical protein
MFQELAADRTSSPETAAYCIYLYTAFHPMYAILSSNSTFVGDYLGNDSV